ncbi:hypothetical protein Cni_G20122 [Canna indica]|uniref:Uncharacterized protein n=1 Tax=Canna indica TaxID=4628 RepID=A0AAQ3KNH2_9LILI|nr:hypothetical protein Cni_G20122 [Canna indica]
MNLKHLKLFSDCKSAINILKGFVKPPWYVKDLVNDIPLLSSSLDIEDWGHLRRQNNARAHHLAKSGLNDAVTILEDPKKWSSSVTHHPSIFDVKSFVNLLLCSSDVNRSSNELLSMNDSKIAQDLMYNKNWDALPNGYKKVLRYLKEYDGIWEVGEKCTIIDPLSSSPNCRV